MPTSTPKTTNPDETHLQMRQGTGTLPKSSQVRCEPPENAPPDNGNIRICQWNCQGLRSKLASLIEAARQDEIDIFLLHETLLPDTASPSPPGYNAFHLHRIPGTRQGLSTYVRHTLSCHPVHQAVDCGEGTEVLATELQLPRTKVNIYNIYRTQQAELNLGELFELAAN